jgi:hypothetical protein
VKHKFLLVSISIALHTAACVVSPQASPSPSPTSFTTATISPSVTTTHSPTPEPEGHIEALSIIRGQGNDFNVVGILRNISTQSWTDIAILVAVWDTNGNLIDHQTVNPLLKHFGPNETGPFVAFFETPTTVDSVTAEVIDVSTTSFERSNVQVKVTSTIPTAEGQLAILGTIANTNSYPVFLHGLSFLAVDMSSEITGFATLAAGPTHIDSQRARPFLAFLETDATDYTLLPYPDAVQTTTLLPIEVTLAESPRFETTEQDHLFIVGEVRNDASYQRWVRLLVSLEYRGELIAFTTMDLPTPLKPGESRAFAVTDFPGLREQMQILNPSMEALNLIIKIEPNLSRDYDEVPIPLGFEIELLEALGSSLILKGSISNSTAVTLNDVTVLATARSTAGEVITAGWLTIVETLDPGEIATFVLPLAIPKGADPAMIEFDVQAFGFTR